MILSEKYLAVTSVYVPSMLPAAVLWIAGYATGGVTRDGEADAIDKGIFEDTAIGMIEPDAFSVIKLAERKHKVLHRRKVQDVTAKIHNEDTNAIEILPKAGMEMERKKADLRAALKSQGPAMSGKKRKRLDKYIDKKLRKEENLELIKKLSNAKIDTALLKSSRSLGTPKPLKRNVLSPTSNYGQEDQGLQSKYLGQNSKDSEGSDNSVEEDAALGPVLPYSRVAPAVGSGLKRSLEVNADGNPVIKKRKRLKQDIALPERHPDDAISWDEFSPVAESEASFSSSPPSPISKAVQIECEDNLDSETDPTDEDHFDDDDDGDKRKARSSAFKAWATSQVNEALNFIPTATNGNNEASLVGSCTGIKDRDISDKFNVEKSSSATTGHLNFEPRDPDVDHLPAKLVTTGTPISRKTYAVTVHRPPNTEETRLRLPIVAEEQRIMEAIHNNSTVVIAGETGSGKTTQVPQFLYEAGYGQKDGPYPGIVGVTQPRRVAAMSMASRVANELGGDHALRIAHQVRFDSTVAANTAIKFMTDGILIREVASDFALSKYAVIIVDEAHERSANTDILIGLLSRIVDLRDSMSKEDHKFKPLKLIIMSATLRVQDFVSNTVLFRKGAPPLVQVEGRQHPVVVHFARKTETDYVEHAYRKICRGHKMLPPGGMLVFLTGQDEINVLARRLKAALGENERGIDAETDEPSTDDELEDFDVPDVTPSERVSNIHVLPLYSQLPTKDQLRVFEPTPEGARMIVLATNVAETSLTIPGIRYVFDSGRAKAKLYDEISGVQSFEVGWISKSSASQRAGRAGRIGPGHCYRLYSSAIYERDFEEHAQPEILRIPIEGLVLQLKSMELHNVINFPFPTPPDRQGLAKAEKLLGCLGALSGDGRITPLGRRLCKYPLSPRFAKMLDIGNQHGCMAFSIMLVAALATPNLFIPESQLALTAPVEPEVHSVANGLSDKARLERRSDYNHAQHLCSKLSRTSDALKAFTALQGFLKATSREQFCTVMFLSRKSMGEASDLVAQLTAIIRNNDPLRLTGGSAQLSTPSGKQVAALQQITAAGYLDQIAILASESPSPPYLGRTPKRVVDVPYLPLFPIGRGRRNADMNIRDVAVYIHPSSLLAHLPLKDMPKYIVFSHLQRGTSSIIEGAKKPKTRMHALTPVSEKVLASLARGTPLLQYGKPIVGEKGSQGWPLPAQKVIQSKNVRGEWNVEQVIDSFAMSSANNEITLETQGKIAIITLNLPKKLNALTQDLYYRLSCVMREVAARNEIYITVLTGNGRFFSAGADVTVSHEISQSEVRRTSLKNFVSNNLEVTNAFYTHPKILVTALNGPVVGLSAALVSFSDFIYAAPHTFLLTPFTSLGLLAEGGASYGFVQRLGISKANEALIMSKRITCAELEQTGFVNKVFPASKERPEEFLTLVLGEVKEKLGDHLNSDSLIQTKALIRKPEREMLDQQNVAEVLGGLERFAQGIPQKELRKIASGEKRHKL
ncbi:MAG: hypothetical protein Q9163_000676 [Psora crenata]